MDFTGKTAIITGGARGLGLSYARGLAQGGAQVVISDIGADKLGAGTDAAVVHAAAAALQAEGLAVLGHGGDLSTDEGCRQLISFTLEAYGQLDILIHNAGWVGYQNIADLDAGFLRSEERRVGKECPV